MHKVMLDESGRMVLADAAPKVMLMEVRLSAAAGLHANEVSHS